MRDLAFATNYRSGANDLVDELFALALSKSTSHRRAAGFFSSSAFQVPSPSLQGLFSRGGSMTLVTSPKLGKDDIEAISEFYVRRSARYARGTLAALFGIFPRSTCRHWHCLESCCGEATCAFSSLAREPPRSPPSTMKNLLFLAMARMCSRFQAMSRCWPYEVASSGLRYSAPGRRPSVGQCYGSKASSLL